MLYLISLFLKFSLAWAVPSEFHGSWVGKGTHIREGHMRQCELMTLSFSGSENTFTFGGGERICEDFREHFDAVTMELRGNDLMFLGKKVGEYREGVLTSHFSAPEGDGRVRNWRMSMRREGSHLVYEESRTMDGETTPLISFSGLLVVQ